MMQSDHNFAHGKTAELSWHVQNCDVIELSKSKLEEKKFLKDFNYELINQMWIGTQSISEPAQIYVNFYQEHLCMRISGKHYLLTSIYIID